MFILNGDVEALNFILAFNTYCHMIDDIVDEEEGKKPEFVIKTFAIAAMLFSCNFWLKHHEKLIGNVLTITNTYADSVAFERSEEPWKKVMADTLRGAGHSMFILVLTMIGGPDKYEQIREVSQESLEFWYYEQH